MFHRIDRLCSTGRADTSRQHLIFRNPCLALNPVEDAVGGLYEVHVHHTGFVVPRLDEDVELWFLCCQIQQATDSNSLVEDVRTTKAKATTLRLIQNAHIFQSKNIANGCGLARRSISQLEETGDGP